jgi:hypothetical protein
MMLVTIDVEKTGGQKVGRKSTTKNEGLQLGKIRNLDCPEDWMLRRCLYHEYSVRTWKRIRLRLFGH